MKRFFNINKECGSEEKDGKQTTNGEVVKKQKYQKYVVSSLDCNFTSIDANHQEGLQRVLCLKFLAPECMHPNKLKFQLETDHPNMASISPYYFIFGSCCDKKHVPRKNQPGTGNEGGSVQSDTKV